MITHSKLRGYGIPWVIIAVSKATTGRPDDKASWTSGCTDNISDLPTRKEVET